MFLFLGQKEGFCSKWARNKWGGAEDWQHFAELFPTDPAYAEIQSGVHVTWNWINCLWVPTVAAIKQAQEDPVNRSYVAKVAEGQWSHVEGWMFGW